VQLEQQLQQLDEQRQHVTQQLEQLEGLEGGRDQFGVADLQQQLQVSSMQAGCGSHCWQVAAHQAAPAMCDRQLLLYKHLVCRHAWWRLVLLTSSLCAALFLLHVLYRAPPPHTHTRSHKHTHSQSYNEQHQQATSRLSDLDRQFESAVAHILGITPEQQPRQLAEALQEQQQLQEVQVRCC
jgi:hypothetical protein